MTDQQDGYQTWIPSPTAIELWLPKKLAPPEWAWEETAANQITLRRGEVAVVGVPLMYVIYLSGNWFVPSAGWSFAAFLMMLLYISSAVADTIDGHVARATKTSSVCGRYLDPIVDKLSVAATYPILLTYYPLESWMAAIPLLIGYDLGMMQLRRINATMRTHRVAKIKQFILFVGTGSLILNIYAVEEAARGDALWATLHTWALIIGPTALWLAAFLCAVGAIMYLRHTSAAVKAASD